MICGSSCKPKEVELNGFTFCFCERCLKWLETYSEAKQVQLKAQLMVMRKALERLISAQLEKVADGGNLKRRNNGQRTFKRGI